MSSEAQQVRACLGNLVALSALAVTWKGLDATGVAHGIAAALVPMLDADVVYVAIDGLEGATAIEIARTQAALLDPGAVTSLRMAILAASPATEAGGLASIANPAGSGRMAILSCPIAFGRGAIIVAGASNPSFPGENQRLTLQAAASQGALALWHWQAETERRQFEAIVAHTPDFIGLATLEGRPLYINPAGLLSVGLTGLVDSARIHVFDLISDADRLRVREQIWPLVRRNGRWIGEVEFQHRRTGSPIPSLVDWFLIEDQNGEPTYAAIVSHDLRRARAIERESRESREALEHWVSKRTSELAIANDQLTTEIQGRKQADTALKETQLDLYHAGRLSAAGYMAATIAHELSQPLAAAANSVNAARRRLKPPLQKTATAVQKILTDVSEQIERAGTIIHRLRAFVSRGKIEIQVRNPNDLIREAASFALIGTSALGITVSFNLADNLPNVLADPVQIQQVIANLVRNSLEAMTDSPRRELIIGTHSANGDAVEFSVADTGAGISEEVADQLYEPFFSTKDQGMGLGLSISRSIVEAHGGILSSAPKAGGGTVFRFQLQTAPNQKEDA